MTEKELLAVIFAIEKFRCYVEGSFFYVVTDHIALKWLQNLSNPSGRLARMSIRLSQFDFKVIHRKGSLNIVADALSRITSENISTIDVDSLKPDKWYNSMTEKIQNFPDKYPTFRVENNLLYKFVSNNHNILSNLREWKLVIPTKNRLEVLKVYHNDECSGHFGVSKTLNRILELYYWPRMRKDVMNYVRKCAICQANKTSTLGTPGLMGQYRDIKFPFQMISCDLLGPYVRSKNGNRFVLVVIDWFTKFILVHPMANATAKGIRNFIENQVFLVYGVPQILCCDNGPQFISKVFKELNSEYKIQKIFYNLKYHPQANHTERANKEIVRCLRSYIGENQKTWDVSLHKIAQAIRTAKHDVTQFSPAFLTFGRNVPLYGDFYGKLSENDNNLPLISDKTQRFKDLESLP